MMGDGHLPDSQSTPRPVHETVGLASCLLVEAAIAGVAVGGGGGTVYWFLLPHLNHVLLLSTDTSSVQPQNMSCVHFTLYYQLQQCSVV